MWNFIGIIIVGQRYSPPPTNSPSCEWNELSEILQRFMVYACAHYRSFFGRSWSGFLIPLFVLLRLLDHLQLHKHFEHELSGLSTHKSLDACGLMIQTCGDAKNSIGSFKWTNTSWLDEDFRLFDELVASTVLIALRPLHWDKLR